MPSLSFNTAFYPIDEKLFAHITSDAFLIGTNLQGDNFSRTIGFLNHFFDLFYQDNISPDILNLKTALLSMKEREEQLNSSYLDNFIQTIYADIQTLPQDQYLLLPGGWTSAKGGHAMVYEFRKDNNGDLLFSIYNSGSGLQYHEHYSDKNKERYNTKLQYRIPHASLNQPFLKQFLEKLFKIIKTEDYKNTYPKHLYEVIFPTLALLDGKIEPDNSQAVYTPGQFSGTCSQHSLNQILKSLSLNKDEYKRFMFYFKSYAIDCYVEQLSNDQQLQNPQYNYLLRKAIQQNLSLLNRKSEQDPSMFLFNDDEKKTAHLRLIEYLKAIRTPKTEAEIPFIIASEWVIPTAQEQQYSLLSQFPLPDDISTLTASPEFYHKENYAIISHSLRQWQKIVEGILKQKNYSSDRSLKILHSMAVIKLVNLMLSHRSPSPEDLIELEAALSPVLIKKSAIYMLPTTPTLIQQRIKTLDNLYQQLNQPSITLTTQTQFNLTLEPENPSVSTYSFSLDNHPQQPPGFKLGSTLEYTLENLDNCLLQDDLENQFEALEAFFLSLPLPTSLDSVVMRFQPIRQYI